MSQVVFGGRGWRAHPDVRDPMFSVFPVVRQLHEVRWYLADGLDRTAAAPVWPELRSLDDELVAMSLAGPDALLTADPAGWRDRARPLLRAASGLVRASGGPDRSGLDLAGQDLRRAALADADLHGASLIAADLRDISLGSADLLGADLRDARVTGADLRAALFLTQGQVDSARGDDSTRLPGRLARPSHWPS